MEQWATNSQSAPSRRRHSSAVVSVAGGAAVASGAVAFAIGADIAVSRAGHGNLRADPGGQASPSAAASDSHRSQLTSYGWVGAGACVWSAAAAAALSARRRRAVTASQQRRYVAAAVLQPGKKVVGIDLGTTTSVVAVMEGQEPRVIPNAEGERLTPSVVAFTKDKELLVGRNAKRQAIMNPLSTYHSVKRFIGRKMDEVVEEATRFSYEVKDAGSRVELDCPNLEKQLAPEEVSAHVLRKLQTDAVSYLRAAVDEAVITVPAYFNDAQRQATKAAARIAGLDVLRISNEPTMAALAYGLDQTNLAIIAVLDLGGGTFDISILEVQDGVLEVLAVGGDSSLGGNDFDQRIISWLLDKFLEKEGIDLSQDKQALQRITEAAELAKMDLSAVNETRISVPFIAADENGPKHIEETLTRDEFRGMCEDLLDRIREPVEQAKEDANLRCKKWPKRMQTLTSSVLVGGSSRIPFVQEVAQEVTDYRPMNNSVNPEEVVALGAAVQASMVAGEVEDIMLLEVTPLTLGVETNGGVFTKMVERNSGIPVKVYQQFTTTEDFQDEIEINVLQGERPMAADNKSLGKFRLTNILPAPAGVPKFEVEFRIGFDGILEVEARDQASRQTQSIRVDDAARLDEEEIDAKLEESMEFWAEDESKMENAELKHSAKQLIYQTDLFLQAKGGRMEWDCQISLRALMPPMEQTLAAENIDYILLRSQVKEFKRTLMHVGQRFWGNQVAPDGRPGPGKRRTSGGAAGSGGFFRDNIPSWVQDATDEMTEEEEELQEQMKAEKEAFKRRKEENPFGPYLDKGDFQR